ELLQSDSTLSIAGAVGEFIKKESEKKGGDFITLLSQEIEWEPVQHVDVSSSYYFEVSDASLGLISFELLDGQLNKDDIHFIKRDNEGVDIKIDLRAKVEADCEILAFIHVSEDKELIPLKKERIRTDADV